ncbi:hypothetical protein DRQ50_14485 [bacterium]|nr:MAG: hypothetical protein DRQ50_14485 [bacterium]
MRPSWWGAITGLLLGAALGGALLLVRGGDSDTGNQPGNGTQPPVTVPDSAGGDTLTSPVPGGGVDDLMGDRANAIVLATRRVAPAVVSINVIQQQAVRNPNMEMLERLGFLPRREYVRQVQNMGSGVIISADGLIVTNQHVVAGAIQLIVTLSDGRQFQAVLMDEIPRYDLAILRIESRDLPVAPMAWEDNLLIGEWAIAIGSPFGYLLADTQPTVTVGVISALNRDMARRSNEERPYLGMIQTDAAINPGNSGGPLVNTRGEVVGINTFILSDSGGSVGIGFAVPAARVRTVVDEIRRYGHYRDIDLGVRLAPLSPSAMHYLELDDPVGVLVDAVREDAPAWKAGLRRYDVLRKIEGRPATSLSMIERLVYDSNVGDRLDFSAERAGEIWSGSIELEERR